MLKVTSDAHLCSSWIRSLEASLETGVTFFSDDVIHSVYCTPTVLLELDAVKISLQTQINVASPHSVVAYYCTPQDSCKLHLMQ